MRKSKVGRLSNRVTIQAANLVADGSGGNVETWINAQDVWAETLPGRSDRMIDALASSIHSDVIFRVREQVTVSKKNRILYEGRTCSIEGIRDWEQDREFKYLDCKYDNKDTPNTGNSGSIQVSGIRTKYLASSTGTSVTDTELIGATLIGVFRNGIGLLVDANPNSGEEYSFNSITGTFTFGSSLSINEYVFVQWHAV